MEIDETTKEINKLLDLYSRKIQRMEIELKSLLIDFVVDYNKIWRETE